MNAPHRPDLRWPAATNAVPKAIFDDPVLFERELEAIFYGPEWHPVAVRGELPRRGDFKHNDEAGNMPRWEWYRKALGFVRERA